MFASVFLPWHKRSLPAVFSASLRMPAWSYFFIFPWKESSPLSKASKSPIQLFSYHHVYQPSSSHWTESSWASCECSLKYVKFYVNCVLAVLMCNKITYTLLKPQGEKTPSIGLACTSPSMGMSIIRESYIKRRFSHNLTKPNWVRACWKEGGKLFFCLTVFSDMLIMAVTYRTQSVSSIDR